MGAQYGQFPVQYQQGQAPPAPPPIPAHYGSTRPVPTQEYQKTATVKNPVNVKKHTIQLKPLPDQPNVLSISFTFDADEPCRISTFVMCREDKKVACKLTASSSGSREPVMYQAGLNQQFPASDEAALMHTLNISAHGHQQWLGQEPDIFPLVVRVDCLTAEARSQGRSLEQAPVGDSLPSWLNAQTTYCKLQPHEEGGWGAQVLMQKIWVQGTSFELQEIYGLEQNRSSNRAGGLDDIEGKDCVICMNAERNTTVLPCRHMCMCYDCAQAIKVQASQAKCPICRNEIESMLKITLPPRA